MGRSGAVRSQLPRGRRQLQAGNSIISFPTPSFRIACPFCRFSTRSASFPRPSLKNPPLLVLTPLSPPPRRLLFPPIPANQTPTATMKDSVKPANLEYSALNL